MKRKVTTILAVMGLTIAMTFGLVAPASAASLNCAAVAHGMGNTATARLTRGTPPTCHPGVRGHWRPAGAPLIPAYFRTDIQWARWGWNYVTLTTLPQRVGQTAHVTGTV